MKNKTRIYIAVAALLGGIFNRIRGGGFSFIRNPVKEKLPSWLTWLVDGKIMNMVAFGLFIGLLTTPLTGVLAALGMLAGQAPGWGDYIGAAGGWRLGLAGLPNGISFDSIAKDSKEYQLYKPLKEWPPIDFLIKFLLNKPSVWGFVGLSLRGILWGLCLSLALFSLWPMVGSATMGIVYFGLCRYTKNGWEISEVVFGIILWSFAAFSIL